MTDSAALTIAAGMTVSVLIYYITWMRIARESGEDCTQDAIGFAMDEEDEEEEDE